MKSDQAASNEYKKEATFRSATSFSLKESEERVKDSSEGIDE